MIWRVLFMGMLVSSLITPPAFCGTDAASPRLPDGMPPVIMAWFMTQDDFSTDSYKTFLDTGSLATARLPIKNGPAAGISSATRYG